jgi:hypothetical protein
MYTMNQAPATIQPIPLSAVQSYVLRAQREILKRAQRQRDGRSHQPVPY